ncbi:Crp/Fnr family transcriptional regulator [Rhabdobacter roseus]|uniref:CRP-like cAMP-binding protein n=1 Tax=Rhabdobacter roseus TaxID=1655419 RepID=A0A840TV11_9BACT|nr:Crp/Fnr family transcriptional regulator [Rhabdobacter roseus]MBB5283918.1 CRP-like cAMP-binding protein [Rhabdobacter roseus]
MNEKLIQFLSKFNELNENQVQELAGLMTVVEIKKNNNLVKEGQACNLCYFVLKGCLRQYIIQDGTEKTIGIYTENQAVNYYSNQIEQQKSESYLTCIEDSVLLIGNPEKDKELFIKFPILADITRKMIEADFGKTQSTLAKFITSSPEQRYLNLINERPELLQRVPQYFIASYLGMTPESLSRIRKRILKTSIN